MPQIIDLKQGVIQKAVKRGFRNWVSRFREDFGPDTRLCHLSIKTLAYLAQDNEQGTFYIYDLIMNLKGLGSGFGFGELSPEDKIAVIDRHLFLLDQIRFECMKRLLWLDSYPGEAYSIVELITDFEALKDRLKDKPLALNAEHPAYDEFTQIDAFERESFIRKLMPEALEEMAIYSTTL
ncbi:MAG: hypothetical protein SV686_07570 [Thermodesulfobacteriota bacterium]|nr:hypothetical protein [Thermodesulfobacteriota bacterium]